MDQHYNLVFLSDPGHGWLSVPRSLVNELGIAQQISSCSYQKGEQVYLEEDCDAPLFIEAAKEAGITIEVAESHLDDDHVRRMEGYVPVETPKIVSFIMSDDEIRERLCLKEDEYIDGPVGIYQYQDTSDGTSAWTIEATLKEGGEKTPR